MMSMIRHHKPRKADDERPLVLFAGGGTGGHFAPALAVAQALSETRDEAECAFLVSRRVLGAFQHALSRYRHFDTPELRWQGWTDGVGLALHSVSALNRTLALLRRLRPQVVVGMGGWGCAPAVAAARMMHVPSMLMEANAVPGRTVRALAHLADAIQLQWPDDAGTLPRGLRTLPCGTPVRSDVLTGDRRRACRHYRLDPERVTMLVMGGTQGARDLNRLVLDALAHVQADGLQVLHVTGERNLGECRRRTVPPGLIYRPVGFEKDMGDAYAVADFAVSRAGGGTLAELSVLGVPSILMPYPHAADNHQLANGRMQVRMGGAVLVRQGRVDARQLAAEITRMVQHPELRRIMHDALLAGANIHAAREMADEILRLSRGPVRAGATGPGRARHGGGGLRLRLNSFYGGHHDGGTRAASGDALR